MRTTPKALRPSFDPCVRLNKYFALFSGSATASPALATSNSYSMVIVWRSCIESLAINNYNDGNAIGLKYNRIKTWISSISCWFFLIGRLSQ